MGLPSAVVEGMLRADGTLELDQKPDLPPGRVTVKMQSISVLPQGDPFFGLLQQIWTTREQAGLIAATVEEVETQRRRFREESADEVSMAGGLREESQRLRVDAPKAIGTCE